MSGIWLDLKKLRVWEENGHLEVEIIENNLAPEDAFILGHSLIDWAGHIRGEDHEFKGVL